MIDLLTHDKASLQAACAVWGEARAHAHTVLRHHYRTHGGRCFDGIGISRSLAERLHASLAPEPTRVVRRATADDGTVKLLLQLAEGATVEAVLMPSHRDGEAAGCVSSQVGCAMGCDFCASTRAGLQRNLTVAEIVGQYLRLCQEAARIGRRVRRLVFMGMGEPMHNLDAVIPAIHRIADPLMGQLGWRRITVSTVGIVQGIERLAQAQTGVHLAVSLHAPDDETRASIVPTTKRYKVAQIVEAARRFAHECGRPVTIEYCLLAGVNDADGQADALAALVRDFPAHVNVIPYNPIGAGLSGRCYQRPSAARVERFVARVAAGGAPCHARVTRGDDVMAACGQLRERGTV